MKDKDMMNKKHTAKYKKLIEEDRKKDVFSIISEICYSDKINDAEWVKDCLTKAKESSNE